MFYILGFLGLFSALLYWCYKKFRQAPYKPGMVQEEAQLEGFDEPELYQKSILPEGKWLLPNDIELFFFPPANTDKSNPPVLAIHGGPSIAPPEPWSISSKIPNMYLYHARGCGHSSRPHHQFPTPGSMWPGMKLLEQDLGIGRQVGDMERIRRRLGVEQFDLVGHSFGGFLATLYAAEFPTHVRSLTLLVPAAVLVMPSSSSSSTESDDLFQIVEKKLQARGDEEEVKEYKAFLKRYLDFGSLPNETDATLAMRQAEFAKWYYRVVEGAEKKKPVDTQMIGGMACFATFLSLGMEHDYTQALKERLARTTFPVSIVHGAKDIVPKSTSRKYIDLFPSGQVEFHSIEDGDHDLFEFPAVGDIVMKTIGRAKKWTFTICEIS